MYHAVALQHQASNRRKRSLHVVVGYTERAGLEPAVREMINNSVDEGGLTLQRRLRIAEENRNAWHTLLVANGSL